MRVFCFPSTDSGRTKVSPASAFLSALPFRRALPEALAPAGGNQGHVSAQSASDAGAAGRPGGGRTARSPLQRVTAGQRGLKCAINAVWQCHLAPAGHRVSLVRALVLGAARLNSHRSSSSVRGSPKSHAPGGEQLPAAVRGLLSAPAEDTGLPVAAAPPQGQRPAGDKAPASIPRGLPGHAGAWAAGAASRRPPARGSARAAPSRDSRTAAGP